MNSRPRFDPIELPPWPVIAGFWTFCLGTAAVILGISAYTVQLDDIKVVGLYTGGAVMLLTWCLLRVFNMVDPPPRIVWVAYAAYLGICVVSTMFSRPYIHWIGWQYVGYYLSTLGFVLLGSSVLTTKRMVEWTLKFWVLMALATTIFGLAHYMGAFEALYGRLFPNGPPRSGSTRLHDLIVTFRGARSMLSTILNVQFFGNFLQMVLPATAACTIFIYNNLRRRIENEEPLAKVIISIAWLTASGLAVAFSLTCIFLTYSKSAYVAIPLMVVLFFCGVYFFAGVRRIPYFGLMVLLAGIMGAAVLYLTWGDMLNNFKGLGESLGPRKFIFGGALNIFFDNWLLGGGPGSFRILFPEYRNPDYHLARISNVTMYAHNWLLDLLAETGILGTLAYLIFLGSIFWLGFRCIRRSEDTAIRVAAVGTMVGIVAILIGSSLTPMTRWPVGSVSLHAMLGSVLGIVMLGLNGPRAYNRDHDLFESAAHNRMLWPSVAMTVLAAWYLVMAWNWSDRFFRAAIYHSEGMRYSDLPDSFFNEAGIATRPEVVEYMNLAVGYFRRSLETDPGRPTTYYKLAHVYNRLNDQRSALETYRAMQKFSPDYSEVHFNLSVIYYNLAQEKKAEADRLGAEAGGAEALAEAIAAIRSSTEAADAAGRMSNKISVTYFQATIWSTLGSYLPAGSEERSRAYRRAGELYAKAADAPVSTVLQEEGQTAREKDERFRSIALASANFEEAGALSEAARWAERQLKAMPTSQAALDRAVSLYRRAEQVDKALSLYEERLRLNPLNPNVRMAYYRLLHDVGRKHEALEQANYLLALDRVLTGKGSDLLPARLEETVTSEIAVIATAPDENTNQEKDTP